MRKTIIIAMLWAIILLGCLQSNVKKTPEPVQKPTPPASKVLYGLAVGPYVKGDPSNNDPVARADLKKQLAVIAPYTKWVTFYGANLGLENAPALAKELNLKVAMGCWLGKDVTANDQQIKTLLGLIKAHQVDLAVVGSESLYRHDLTEDQLIGYIRRVKQTGAKVTTRDVWSEFRDHPKVAAECDVILANIYPFWAKVLPTQPIDSLDANYQELLRTVGDKEVIIGETGWASSGNEPFVGVSRSNPKAAAKYLQDFLTWAKNRNVKYFYFSAFDEPWKARTEGLLGAHWGIWDKNLVIKPEMQAVLVGQ